MSSQAVLLLLISVGYCSLLSNDLKITGKGGGGGDCKEVTEEVPEEHLAQRPIELSGSSEPPQIDGSPQ